MINDWFLKTAWACTCLPSWWLPSDPPLPVWS